MLSNPWLGLAILVVALLAMLVVVRSLRARYDLHPETSRKLAHVGLGLAMLSCPLLFDRVWPVALLALLTMLVLAAMRWLPIVITHFRGVVGGVARKSAGDFYFPVAAALLFVVARGDWILFGVPILALTFADAVAALIGVRYGTIRYRTLEGAKSLEGSVAFFTVAFLATHVPLLLSGITGRAESLLIGLILGLIVMLLEAVSLGGTDNLLIPVGGYLLLSAFLRMGAFELAAVLAVAVLLLVLALVLRRRRTLSDTAMLAGVLVGFVVWSVAGWRWLLPPIALFTSYTALWPRRRLVRERPHQLDAVGATSAAGFAWLGLTYVVREPALLYYLYTLSFAAHLAFFGLRWLRFARPRLGALAAGVRGVVPAWLVLFVPYTLASMDVPRATLLLRVAAAPVFLLLGALAFAWVVPAADFPETRPFPWWRQAVLGFATSALGIAAIVGSLA